jgi:hypothetical protein
MMAPSGDSTEGAMTPERPIKSYLAEPAEARASNYDDSLETRL